MAKLSFLLGASVGYVLGARAGTERYAQIKSGAGQLWRSQPVQQQVSAARHAAKTKAAPAALDAVSGAASAAGDKLRTGGGRIAGSKDDVPSSVDHRPDTHHEGDPVSEWTEEGGAPAPQH
ncbi:protoporphyrinogen oxidase [Janibacter sp. YIM B02568]|uniref:protoporphyrinogen oxidase n=1 Tax=Janibacter endophyticus TaxID=2806261 RepID=UPI00194DF6E9|nr:protoporphyrinogen oxidase [Janibacter endophyticus]MBM6544645.1 protoporphyrinogen oxidase [Janibacter endophyticus]